MKYVLLLSIYLSIYIYVERRRKKVLRVQLHRSLIDPLRRCFGLLLLAVHIVISLLHHGWGDTHGQISQRHILSGRSLNLYISRYVCNTMRLSTFYNCTPRRNGGEALLLVGAHSLPVLCLAARIAYRYDIPLTGNPD